jgi:hypothetical protein
MAVEAQRGCGYRKVGALYLVAEGQGRPCCRLPIELRICPACSTGIKPSRGWTWIELAAFLRASCTSPCSCPLKAPQGRIGLLWVGEKFYPTPGHFDLEASALGTSRRIAAIPRGFVLGETWVALAHRRALAAGDGAGAAIFRLFRPTRLEMLVRQSDFENTEAMDRLRMRGITPLPVPDDDRDHRAGVHDDAGDELPTPNAPRRDRHRPGPVVARA